ncbi:hypothetical protein [Cetobacterium sp.]|uniref:hypothetical protein n=1 Tax=Cetobacterium sp. TaxID=2071632 RepID=UPI003F37B088
MDNKINEIVEIIRNSGLKEIEKREILEKLKHVIGGKTEFFNESLAVSSRKCPVCGK